MQPNRTARGAAGIALLLLMAGCASSGGAVPATATDAQWRQLATPRAAPLPDAPRLAVMPIQVVGTLPVTPPASLTAELVVQELAVAGLLRRRDVRFVERRRFSAAVEAERNGSRPAGAPPAGVSERASYGVGASWLSVTPGQSTLEVRLVEFPSGRVIASSRETMAGETSAVGVARAFVAVALRLVDEVDTRPSWTDPAPLPSGMTGVSDDALASFMSGLAAEERWAWEEARRGYSEAREDDFPEAAVLLARTARLRMGGTLGES